MPHFSFRDRLPLHWPSYALRSAGNVLAAEFTPDLFQLSVVGERLPAQRVGSGIQRFPINGYRTYSVGHLVDLVAGLEEVVVRSIYLYFHHGTFR